MFFIYHHAFKKLAREPPKHYLCYIYATSQSSQKCDIKKLVFALQSLNNVKMANSMEENYTLLFLHGKYSHYVLQAIVLPTPINDRDLNIFKRAKKNISFLDPSYLISKKSSNHNYCRGIGFIRKAPETIVTPRLVRDSSDNVRQ